MLEVTKLQFKGVEIAISGDDCPVEVLEAARALILHAGAAGDQRLTHTAYDPYNGWPNYESWLAFEWAGADQETHRRTRAIVKLAKGRAGAADRLKELFEQDNPLEDTADFFTDILNQGLYRVDWSHVAEHIAQEIGKDW